MKCEENISLFSIKNLYNICEIGPLPFMAANEAKSWRRHINEAGYGGVKDNR